MLSLLSCLTNGPSSRIHFLHNYSLLLYHDVDTILLFNSESLQLLRVLLFNQAFPSHRHPIEHLAVGPAMNLIFASSHNKIAAWTLTMSPEGVVARVHSSLTLPPSSTVSALSCSSGLLAVGSDESMAVYTLILENDLPVWSEKWCTEDIATPSVIHFSPSLMYIAAITMQDTVLRLYSTTTGQEAQLIPHPRPLTDIYWRHSEQSSRDDLILYTITRDSTLRIFLPVLDDPMHLQLHASLDLSFSHVSANRTSNYEDSQVFILDRDILSSFLRAQQSADEKNDGQGRQVKELLEQGWDVFLRHLFNGSVVITAVANVDRRPPTLLQHFTLQHTAPNVLPSHDDSHPPQHLHIVPRKDASKLNLISTNPLAVYHLDLLSLIFPSEEQPQAPALRLAARINPGSDFDSRNIDSNEKAQIKLIRTPEGRGFALLSNHNGNAETWSVTGDDPPTFRKTGAAQGVDLIVSLDQGSSFALYSRSSNTLTLRCAHSATPHSPCSNLSLEVPELSKLFTLPRNTYSTSSVTSKQTGAELIFGITSKNEIAIFNVFGDSSHQNSCAVTLQSLSTIPQPDIAQVVAVDPMAWSFRTAFHHSSTDVLLTIDVSGELAFWVPYTEESNTTSWKCTSRVKTGKRDVKMVACSSSKKSVLVVASEDGSEELTIWDSRESSFSSGLEYQTIYSSPINDLDWSATPDGQSILAVGFEHHVDLLCQQRKSYFNDDPDWAVTWRVDSSRITPLSIDDSVWLAGGTLLIAAGPQLFVYGQSLEKDSQQDASLFQEVARQNGPLPDWHPQMILQCLLWGKVELVKEIIVRLMDTVETRIPFEPIPTERYLTSNTQLSGGPKKQRYNTLFNTSEPKDEEEERFSRKNVSKLILELKNSRLPHLSSSEQAHLQSLVEATLEVDEQRRSLDSNGLRYVSSMWSFYALNRIATTPPSSTGVSNAMSIKHGKRERLRYRDMIWGFYSESQDIIMNEAARSCQDGKMLWSDARALGVPIWLNSVDALKAQLEVIARNEYMQGDLRDPTACSLFYFALRKVKLVHGLWRQASWHKECPLMMKFLSNDFSQPRWRTAALKNAFALLGKRRFEYAAAFFLLGGSLKDAVNVCVRNLDDFQLGVAIARVMEQGDEGPVLRDVLTTSVLPIAFKKGNRWLANWAFWLLHRRDLAVRVLLAPLHDIASALDIVIGEVKESPYDDTSLALLFSQLRSKTLQAAKGASEISGAAEWSFILQIARVFCRMGCHVLALDLVRSWTFEPPPPPVQLPTLGVTHSPVYRPVFGSHVRRRSSILIDMEVASLPTTRPTSPEPSKHSFHAVSTVKEDEGVNGAMPKPEPARTGIGNLMKTAKHDVQAPEFDMGAFF